MQEKAKDLYNETLERMFNRLQAFHRVGAAAYKPGLQTTLDLSAAFGNPHEGLHCIHVAGTNGKGSTAHTLAAVLQAQGYKTGLYTSPHLLDFNERIRVNGEPISHDAVIDFCERAEKLTHLNPSFFEMATVMAFEHFRREQVDIAVIETGLGGRLDSTNVITPEVSIITNIGLEHTDLLGDTRVKIAFEKGGITKPGVPVVIGEAKLQDEIRDVFNELAVVNGSPIIYACDNMTFRGFTTTLDEILYYTNQFGNVRSTMKGREQIRNTNTILTALQVLNAGGKFHVDAPAVQRGFRDVCAMTGLRGRWEKISDNPKVICDTGHNPHAWANIAKNLDVRQDAKLRMVIGFVGDKDITHIAEHLPKDAIYYFVTPSTPRAAAASDVAHLAEGFGITGNVYDTVAAGWCAARAAAAETDMIFVGGSNFVVADFLPLVD